MGRSIIHSTPGPVVRRDRTRPDDVEFGSAGAAARPPL